MPDSVLDWIVSHVLLTRTRSALYKQPWKKNQRIDEPLQEEPLEDDVKAASVRPDGKSELEDEASFEVVSEEKLTVVESLEDECALVSPSLCTQNLSASSSPSSNTGAALPLSFRQTYTCKQKILSASTSPSSTLPLSFCQTNTCEQKNLSASTSPSSALTRSFRQTNTCEQKNISTCTSPSSNVGSALPLCFRQNNTCKQKIPSANTSPSSSARSTLRLPIHQTSSCEQKEEEKYEIISASSSSSDGELSSAPSFRKWNTTTSSLSSSKIQDNSINSVIKTTRQETTCLTPAVIASPSPEELTNELKMEISYMKSQLSTYDENFVGLQMGRELGSGTFGRVYEANTRLEKVAIKVLMAEKLATLTECDYYMNMHEFYEEALLHSDLNHPNILSFEFIISDVPPYGLPGMATEFMSGDLFHYIRRVGGHRSWDSVWNIANQVANGLKYMHSMKVVHFDVKSSNILVNYSGNQAPNILTCKVADFGLAVKNHSGVMRLNSQRGTTHYMAPEVLRASHSNMEFVTEKVDIYSFGILLWELIMGVLPYNRMTDEEIGSRVLNGSRPPVPNWCDSGWRTLMEACWRADQSLRPNFDQIVEILCRLIGAP